MVGSNSRGAETRTRIMATAETLFRRQGYAGTGLAQIAGESDVRVGSIYHFFADKRALAEESVRVGGAAYGAMVLTLLEHGAEDPVESLGAAFVAAAEDLASTDYADACPIATLALEVASTDEVLRGATADVFIAWIDGLSVWCRRIVDDPELARELAIAVLTSLEGAFILARALRDPEPLLAAGRSLVARAEALRR
ncbi:TetR/AcrR family transcriptional regulator [Gordonia soli]|uniref:Putative TetR family transcriptional regulator n=1 Tax=Gordonia soli NBRC 108243 TaxID=1223545 RepID=M0QS59_9ACTN|nr:TetR/AcrR family transcriptional regulator [Gordonia soli]GAC70877.1 putative TetR family transcriptional regulator [Gordonia soli NBRC 108243]